MDKGEKMKNKKCINCNGTGLVQDKPLTLGVIVSIIKCPVCNGTGREVKS
jgi:DnaJ-class molecular chaperone